MNELLVWWYLWVNSNYDVLIMTVTLLVEAALVWEIIRLNKKIDSLDVDDLWDLCTATENSTSLLKQRFELMCKDIEELQIRYSVVEAGNSLEEAIKTYLEYNKNLLKKVRNNMLKVISKQNCERCENVKNYLTQRGIGFEVVMAEEQGLNYWREFIMDTTGKVGFPLLGKYSVFAEGDEVWEYINGSTEEIIEKLNEWYPQVQDRSTPEQINYSWGSYDSKSDLRGE